MKAWLEVFGVALRLGLTSFGGPVAHLGYFHREYVVKRRWVDEAGYADLVALCQALPGPASSQVGMALGHARAGVGGAVAAWLGFTLPSALLMAGFAWLGAGANPGGTGYQGLVRGLGLVALGVVAQAVWALGRRLVTGWATGALALGTALGTALVPGPWTTVGLLVAAAGVGFLVAPGPATPTLDPPTPPVSRFAIVGLAAFAGLLFVLPWAAGMGGLWPLADGFYRSGALVFGGGHVVLPLLRAEPAIGGAVSPAAFLAGYGLVQAVPGPLFSLAGYLGFLVAGPAGALVALVGIFLPSFLLVLGVLPFWSRLKAAPGFRRALAGVNAAVVGLLAWAWYDPVFVGAVHGVSDLALGATLLLVLLLGKAPWAVVVAGALGGLALQALGL